jgi:hypothetical protein
VHGIALFIAEDGTKVAVEYENGDFVSESSGMMFSK